MKKTWMMKGTLPDEDEPTIITFELDVDIAKDTPTIPKALDAIADDIGFKEYECKRVNKKEILKILKEEGPDSLTVHDAKFIRSLGVGRNDPCFCGSGRKYKKCCNELKMRDTNVNQS